jgi:threonine/homoserine/homoserine lactone efflux protein
MAIVLGTLMGLAYVAPPGPVNLETVRRGLAGGFRMALYLQVGSLMGDLFYAVIAVVGAPILITNTVTRTLLGVAAMALLVSLGWAALRDGWQGLRPGAVSPALIPSAPHPLSASTARRTLLAGAAISASNPLAVVFWLSVDRALLDQPHGQQVLLLGSFALTCLAWVLVLPFLVGWCRATVSDCFFPWVSLACGPILMACGLALGRTLIVV